MIHHFENSQLIFTCHKMASTCGKFHCDNRSSLENTRVGYFCPLPPQIKYPTPDTPNKIGLTNFNFVFSHFSDLQNLFKCMDNMFPCYSLLNIKVIWLYMVFPPPPIAMRIWKFVNILRWQNFFLHLWQDKPLRVMLKANGGVISITILLHIHISLFYKQPAPRKEKCFFLRIS